MKTFIIVLILMISLPSFAKEKNKEVRLASAVASTPLRSEGITLSFNRVSVIDFINVIYGDIFHLNYALDPALVDKLETVTVNFRNSNDKYVYSYTLDLLDSLDIELVNRGEYFLFKPKSPHYQKEIFLYRAKYRSVSYIIDLLGNLFSSGKFSFQAGDYLNSAANPTGKARSADSTGASTTTAPPVVADQSSPSASRKDSDAFIYEGKQEEIDRLKSLLAIIDVPVGEVAIQAILYEVGNTSNKGNATTLAWSILGGKLGLQLGQSGIAGNSIKFKSTTIEAIFSALSTDSRFRVISSPSLRVKSGGHGLISVGSDVPVLGAVSLDSSGRATQSVTMQPSGVILDILPTVNDAGIDLTVKQQISNFVPTTTGVNATPTLIKREVSTMIGTSHDEFVMLGGLNESKVNKDTSGFSFLPSWTHSESAEFTKTEILLVLHVRKL